MPKCGSGISIWKAICQLRESMIAAGMERERAAREATAQVERVAIASETRVGVEKVATAFIAENDRHEKAIARLAKRQARLNPLRPVHDAAA
jgi:hypothetical protein